MNPDRPIRTDVCCGVCGYNLRGLPRTRTCPECGTAIRKAIRAERPRPRLAPMTGRMIAVLFVAAGIGVVFAPSLMPRMSPWQQLTLGVGCLVVAALLGHFNMQRAWRQRSGGAARPLLVVLPILIGAIAGLFGIFLIVSAIV